MILKHLLTAELTPIETAKWINAHELPERIQVFTNINLGFEKKEQLKKIYADIGNELIESDLRDSELLTLLSTIEKLGDKIKTKLNKP